MGTTESLPEDEASPPPDESPRRPSAEGMPDRPRHPTSPRLPQQDLHPTHPHQQRQPPSQPQQRPRPRPPQNKPIHRLEGLIVGGPKTGKRTLLQRLEGKDPFQNLNGNNNNQLKQPSKTAASITIPYKQPLVSLSLERIQLHIQCVHDSSQVQEYSHRHQKQQTQTAFVVILVSPKHKLETTQSYVERLLTVHLDALGYTMETGKSNQSSHTSPLCLCFLLNFRDVATTDFPSVAELEKNVHEILQERGVPKRKIVMDWINVSLLNCYGLDRLHTFIYKAYLLRKEAMLETQLVAVQSQMTVTVSSETSPIAYNEFVAAVAAVAPPQPEEKTTSQSPAENKQEQRRQIHPSPKPSKKEDTKQTTEKPKQEETEDVSQKKPLPRFPLQKKRRSEEKKQQRMPPRMGKEALEAFLASSSDEEDVKTRQRNKQRSTADSSSDDDDDEDDFFYNEKGQRTYNHQAPPQRMYQSDSSSDSESDSSQHSQVQNLRTQPKSQTPAKTKENDDSSSDNQSQQREIDKSPSQRHNNVAVDSISQKRSPDRVQEGELSVSNVKHDNDLSDHEHDRLSHTKPDTEAEVQPEVSDDLSAASSSDNIPSIDDDGQQQSASKTPTVDESTSESERSNGKTETPTNDAQSAEVGLVASVPADGADSDEAPVSRVEGDAELDGGGAAYADESAGDEDDEFKITTSKSVDDEDDGADGESDLADAHVLQPSQAEESKVSKEAKLKQEPDDDDFEGDRAYNETPPSDSKAMAAAVPAYDSDDSDEYVIGANAASQVSNQSSAISQPSEPKQAVKDDSSPQKAPPSSGLSAAAMAAVLAAQQEAELMLQQQQQYASSHPEDSEKKRSKKSKKKKSGKEKKKKKNRSD